MEVVPDQVALREGRDAGAEVVEEGGRLTVRQVLGEGVEYDPKGEAGDAGQGQGLGLALALDLVEGIPDLRGDWLVRLQTQEGGAMDLAEELAQGALALARSADQDDPAGLGRALLIGLVPTPALWVGSRVQALGRQGMEIEHGPGVVKTVGVGGQRVGFDQRGTG